MEAPVADEKRKVPTWGYHAVKPAQIFHLNLGEKLPEGWHDAPVPQDESSKSGDTSMSDGNPALEAAHARIRELEQIIEQGKAENAELREELKGADEEADVAAVQVKTVTEERDALKARVDALAAENEQLRAGHAASKKGK